MIMTVSMNTWAPPPWDVFALRNSSARPVPEVLQLLQDQFGVLALRNSRKARCSDGHYLPQLDPAICQNQPQPGHPEHRFIFGVGPIQAAFSRVQ